MTDGIQHEFPLRPNFLRMGALAVFLTCGVCGATFLFFHPDLYAIEDHPVLNRLGHVLFGFITFGGPVAVFLLIASLIHLWLVPRRIALTSDSIIVPSLKRFGFNREEVVVPFRAIETIQIAPAFGDWLVIVRYRGGRFVMGNVNFPSREVADQALRCLGNSLAKIRPEQTAILRSLSRRGN